MTTEKVIETLNTTNVNVTSPDIVACHRLQRTKKGKAKTEPKFSNRKNVVSMFGE